MSRRRLGELDDFQQMLIEAKIRIIQKTGNPDISDAELATDYFGINPASLSQYKLKVRRPNFRTVLTLYESGYFPERIFELFGYNNPKEVDQNEYLRELLNDPIFKYLYDNWAEVSRVAPDKIREIHLAMLEELDEGDTTSGNGHKRDIETHRGSLE